MIKAFVTSNSQFSNLEKDIEAAILHHENDSTSNALLFDILELVNEAKAINKFQEFVETKSLSDKTWQLWANFVFQDCFCYISLFLSLRTSDWELRVSSLKSMASLFLPMIDRVTSD